MSQIQELNKIRNKVMLKYKFTNWISNYIILVGPNEQGISKSLGSNQKLLPSGILSETKESVLRNRLM